MRLLLALFGCSDPLFQPPFSVWTGCLHEGWITHFEPDPRYGYLIRSGPGDATHLYVHAAWDIAPYLSGRTLASVSLDLPRPLEAGYQAGLEQVVGVYLVAGHSSGFRSRNLEGTVEVLAIDDTRAQVRLDLHAARPDMGSGEEWLHGVVDLLVTSEERCPE